MFNKLATPCLWMAAFALLAGCEKNELHTSSYTPAAEGTSQVKVFFTSPYKNNPRYQINVNGQRVSTVLTATGTALNPPPYPGGGLNTGGNSTPDYLLVPAQQNTISIAIPKTNTNTDSIQLATSSFAFESTKKYTLYFMDTAANTTSILIVDSLARPDSGYAKYKFVNLVPDLPAADLYLGTVKMASNISYKGVSPSFMVATNNSSNTWLLRTAGGTDTLATYSQASTLQNQRVYTVIGRGYKSMRAIAPNTNDIRRTVISLIYNE
jgi:Domain of unknown function (DUF4397)